MQLQPLLLLLLSLLTLLLSTSPVHHSPPFSYILVSIRSVESTLYYRLQRIHR